MRHSSLQTEAGVHSDGILGSCKVWGREVGTETNPKAVSLASRSHSAFQNECQEGPVRGRPLHTQQPAPSSWCFGAVSRISCLSSHAVSFSCSAGLKLRFRSAFSEGCCWDMVFTARVLLTASAEGQAGRGKRSRNRITLSRLPLLVHHGRYHAAGTFEISACSSP